MSHRCPFLDWDTLPLALPDVSAVQPAPARRAARLVSRGVVEIVKGGRVVDPSTTRGPIRIRRR